MIERLVGDKDSLFLQLRGHGVLRVLFAAEMYWLLSDNKKNALRSYATPIVEDSIPPISHNNKQPQMIKPMVTSRRTDKRIKISFFKTEQ